MARQWIKEDSMGRILCPRCYPALDVPTDFNPVTGEDTCPECGWSTTILWDLSRKVEDEEISVGDGDGTKCKHVRSTVAG